ncbi:hypothetical protein A2767_04055 [Candidatus Roizmanbacteria bacterium RIFCSPHIGHO2_01_FULL_35_10]|uniref:Acetyltransferase n=1 Tax=Candidatus Roizmanbacteria bacterium RIFCSPLOWO2_01_FULL_35_13 TaxID=1802055 RepID=A0A1F7IFI1_9BACT|nr:MAG: hypothetical protein A2767_04055 [Candidatus Roizmanbacteria bacterium RIFCSPHIGHO2_01_FULL_35_10]OGK42126.1 MAG: hypothetical protein A3A74_04785 [Candidatus Roizmanbacteria bacterium RIFCSPLOWO2_01_FULL_35_13]
MKALNEIRIGKALGFIFFTLYGVLIDIVLFSPLKIFLLRLAGAKIGNDVVIHKVRFFNQYHHGFSNLEIGNYCFLGDEVMLDLADKIIIEDHVTISNRALILTHTNVGYKDHPLQENYPRIFKKVKIEKGSFIGAGAIILPGVTISQGAVVGAGAVVTKNVAKNTVVIGSPAKFLKKLK